MIFFKPTKPKVIIQNLLIGFLLLFAGAFACAGDQEYPIVLDRYKPIYALWGNPYTKLEVSFEAKVAKESPVYFGYTQLMMWDLMASSPFFYDVNFNPLLWYRFTLDSEKHEWLDLIPEEHESNGKVFSKERSWDRVGAAYHREFAFGIESKLLFDFKIWYPWHIASPDPSENNPGNLDIGEYRGAWETNLTYANFLGSSFGFSDLTLRLYPGGPSTTNPFMGGQELTLRLRSSSWKMRPLVVLQVFHGYGEDLLLYNVDQFQFRVGLGL